MVTARIIIPVLVLYTIWYAYAAVNCRNTGAGRFADLADGTCKNYTLCIYVNQTDTYISYDAVCPSVSVFNPKTSKCTSKTKYTCNTTFAVTAQPRTKSEICTYEGFIADPEYKNCSTFIQCVNIFGGFTQLRQSCPNNTYFNPRTTLCEANYKCESEKFSCRLRGRFADISDPNCHKYHHCVLLNNGTFVQFNYSCPYDWMFDPRTSRCTTDYVCR